MKFFVPLAFFVVIQQQSCGFGDSSNQKKPVAEPKAAQPRPGLHRFVLTRNTDIAFDSQTGQICKTWDWSPSGKEPTPDPLTGRMPQRMAGEFAPTCLSLYQSYPSGVGVDLPVPAPAPEQ